MDGLILRGRALLCVFVILGATFACGGAPDWDAVGRSVCRVACVDKAGKTKAWGSGFAVDRAGHIVTNDHVVRSCAGLRVQFGGDAPAAATTLIHSARLDLAVIEAANTPTLPLPLYRGARPARALRVYALTAEGPGAGNRPNANERGTARLELKSGDVSLVKTDRHGRPVIQTTAAINKGNSGGPLLDRCGHVLGVVTEKLGGEAVDNIGLAVQAESLDTLLQDVGVHARWESALCDTTDTNPAAAVALAVGAALLLLGLVALRRRASPSPSRSPSPARAARRDAVNQAREPRPTVDVVFVGEVNHARRFTLRPGMTTVGREPAVCDIVLPEHTAGVSRRHLALRLADDGAVQARDCWSSGGVTLARQALRPGEWRAVAPGATLRLGSDVVALRVERV